MPLQPEQYCCAVQAIAEQRIDPAHFSAPAAVYLVSAPTPFIVEHQKQEIELQEDEIFLSPQPFAAYADGTVELFALSFGGAVAAELASLLRAPAIVPIEDRRRMYAQLHSIAAAQTSPMESSVLCYGLLCRLAETLPDRPPLPPLVQKALTAMQNHYAEVYGVEELAQQLGVNKSHLIRCFTAATGTSPGQYLTLTRLQAAKALLQNRNYSLEVVASLCGFSGANYFCRVFKKQTGRTPKEWQAQYQTPLPEKDFPAMESFLYL